jgi:hypothetical protein
MMGQYRLKLLERERGAIFPDDLIDPKDARELITAARARGMTFNEIGRLTGLPKERVRKIHKNETRRVRRDTVDKIYRGLGDPDNRALLDGSLVDPHWTKTMIYALGAQGWSKLHLQDILRNNQDTSGEFINVITRYRGERQIYYRSEKQMKWLVRAIGDKTGPNKCTATKMRKRGYFPTKHYDGEGNLIRGSLNREQRAAYASV